MLRIRKEQVEAFESVQSEKFLDNAMAYVRGEFPTQSEKLDDAALKKLVQNSVNKCEQYNIVNKPDIYQFINLQFIYGFEFDTQLDWAVKILNDTNISAGETRIMELYDEAVNQAAD